MFWKLTMIFCNRKRLTTLATAITNRKYYDTEPDNYYEHQLTPI